MSTVPSKTGKPKRWQTGGISRRPRTLKPKLRVLSALMAAMPQRHRNEFPKAVEGDDDMTREELTEKILDIKRDNGWSWKYITDHIGGMSPVLVVGALLGQQKLVKPLAEKAGGLFGLTPGETKMLNEVPMRGMPMPPTDPLIYRFYELIMINGPAWKALIEEEFGDGIMSAIDFDFDMERQADPKGDRVRVSMSGKFLPYKYYGAEQGIAPLGLKDMD